MKKIVLLLLILTLNLPGYARNFGVKSDAELVQYTDSEIALKITKLRDEDEDGTFPVGTVIHGTVTEHKPNRRIYRDEYIKLHLDKATLPSGQVVTLDQKMKIRPRKLFSVHNTGIGVIAVTGGVLGLTVDMLTLGLPIVRGGLAVWDAGCEIYDRPIGASAWKAGGKGFLDGALFPLPQIFLKARKLGMEEGSKLIVYPTKDTKTVYVSVPRKYTKIENHRK